MASQHSLFDLLFGKSSGVADWLSLSPDESQQPFTTTTHEDRYEYESDLPGMGPDDVSVEVTPEGLLRVWGERKRVLQARAEDGSVAQQAVTAHSFERIFLLPEDALAEQVVASLDKGVLTVTVPRREPQPEPRPRRIAVREVVRQQTQSAAEQELQPPQQQQADGGCLVISSRKSAKALHCE